MRIARIAGGACARTWLPGGGLTGGGRAGGACRRIGGRFEYGPASVALMVSAALLAAMAPAVPGAPMPSTACVPPVTPATDATSAKDAADATDIVDATRTPEVGGRMDLTDAADATDAVASTTIACEARHCSRVPSSAVPGQAHDRAPVLSIGVLPASRRARACVLTSRGADGA